MAPRRSPGPLLSFSDRELQSAESSIVFNPQPLSDDPDAPKKRWYHYLPLCGKPIAFSTLFLIDSLTLWNRDCAVDPSPAAILALYPSRFPSSDASSTSYLHDPLIDWLHSYFFGFLVTYRLPGPRSRTCEPTTITVRRG